MPNPTVSALVALAGRRHWGRAECAAAMDAWRDSGQRLAAFARVHGTSPKRLAQCQVRTSRTPVPAGEPDCHRPPFVELVNLASRAAPRSTSTPDRPQVTVSSGFDPLPLRDAFQALAEPTCLPSPPPSASMSLRTRSVSGAASSSWSQMSALCGASTPRPCPPSSPSASRGDLAKIPMRTLTGFHRPGTAASMHASRLDDGAARRGVQRCSTVQPQSTERALEVHNKKIAPSLTP